MVYVMMPLQIDVNWFEAKTLDASKGNQIDLNLSSITINIFDTDLV